MTRGDEGKLFSLSVPLFTLSPYSARLCAPCALELEGVISVVDCVKCVPIPVKKQDNPPPAPWVAKN